jgi:hypothetical protein
MLALRDRARVGGSYHAHVALTATDAVQLEEEMGLYGREVVQKIQEKYNFGPMTPDLHVEELLYVLGDAWSKQPDVLKREYMTSFETAWGNNHSILSPIVKYENSSVSPRWSHGPVVYGDTKPLRWNDLE